MCGIFGIINSNNSSPNPELLRKATRMLQHRGPDGEGYYSEGALAFGHRRLAIIDLSPKGQQPMQAFGLTITYNGEIYNYLELRNTLKKEGFEFTSQTDTEIVLAAYAHWGKDCVHHFRGMWAFAIYDPKSKEVFCSRDRFGIKPFYFTSIQNAFYFSSEIKAFSILPSWSPVLHQENAATLLLSGQQHRGAATLFQGVSQLLPGQNLIYDLAQKEYRLVRYYDLNNIKQQEISSKTAAEKFRSLFEESIRLHLRADVKIGTAFSGGLDSSYILAQLFKLLNGENIEAITYCSEVKGYDESEFVDAFSKKYPIEIHRISPDFNSLSKALEEVTIAQDEPVLSGSLIAQNFVFKEAKKRGLKVMLDGQGADELLAGYGTYYLPFFKYLLKNKPLQLLPEVFGLLWYHRFPWKKLQGLSNSKNPILGINLKLPTSTISKTDHFQEYSKNMIRSHHLPALLHYEDRNSMAHSIEARVPFLDHGLVEFALSLPPEVLIQKGIRKKVLRDASGNLLPKKILYRYDKLGFATPQDLWMERQGNLVLKLAKEAQLAFPEIFNKNWMEWVGTILSKKQRRHYPSIWRAISLGKWGKLYLSRK